MLVRSPASSGLVRSLTIGFHASVPLPAQSEPEARHEPRYDLGHGFTSRRKNPQEQYTTKNSKNVPVFIEAIVAFSAR